MKQKFPYLFIIFTLLFAQSCLATNIIRDSEIEHAIKQVVDPVSKAAGMKNLTIHILSDDTINAFTMGGEEIFVHSGLITKFDDPDLFRGVIAHEIGHILGKHVTRQVSNIEDHKKVIASSMAIGLASALAGNPTLAIAALMGGSHYSERTILKSSRIYESSADQAAVRLLEKSGNTSSSLIKLLEYLQTHHNQSHANPYELTHPLSSERITAIKEAYAHSKFKQSTTSLEVRHNFERAAAKLKAFTAPISSYRETSKNKEIATYASSIIHFRKGEQSKALHDINELLQLRPQDPYYNELKGQILFEFGNKEAYASYSKAVALLPNDPMIRLGRAVALLNIAGNDKSKLISAIEDFKFVHSKESDNLLPYYFLSVAYEKAGDKSRGLLYSAILAQHQDETKRAKAIARGIIKDFKAGSPEWHKAHDIILTEE